MRNISDGQVYEQEKENAIKDVAQMSDNDIILEQNKIITSLQLKIRDLKEVIKNVYANVTDTVKHVIKNKIFDKEDEISETSDEETEIERSQELDELLENFDEGEEE